MQLNHTLGREITLLNDDGAALWCYDYGTAPRPYFHPLCTPRGFITTLFEPSDHVWHRGLWFTFKFVNGDNFWEEHPPFGIQKTTLPPAILHFEGGSFAWQSEIEWLRPDESPNGGGIAVCESRLITHRPVSETAYALDWDSSLHFEVETLLNRTSFTTWGGYGGLTLRGNRNWLKTQLLFPDGSTDDRPKGVPADWCDLSGVFDGGKNASGGVAIFDHPENGRHPTPWYGGTGSGHYFNAALLFHEPLTVAAGETLRLRYRTLIHDEIWEVSRLQSAYDDYKNA